MKVVQLQKSVSIDILFRLDILTYSHEMTKIKQSYLCDIFCWWYCLHIFASSNICRQKWQNSTILKLHFSFFFFWGGGGVFLGFFFSFFFFFWGGGEGIWGICFYILFFIWVKLVSQIVCLSICLYVPLFLNKTEENFTSITFSRG